MIPKLPETPITNPFVVKPADIRPTLINSTKPLPDVEPQKLDLANNARTAPDTFSAKLGTCALEYGWYFLLSMKNALFFHKCQIADSLFHKAKTFDFHKCQSEQSLR